MKKLGLSLILASVLASGAIAQDGVPKLPAPIQALVDEGAQIRFLGKDKGFDAWLTIKNGQEQYFYVKPDQSAFIMGVLFDDKGEMITIDQVQRLQNAGGDLLDVLASEKLITDGNSKVTEQAFELKSPSERLYYDLENSNWVPIGDTGAPVLYSFIDPQCPHCHKFIEEIRENYIENGRVQVRMIPVGFREETRAQSAFLMATPNPQERWFRHMDGDESALPAKSELNQQGVQRNLSLMQSWKLNVTPMVVYRGKDGTVKIVRGKPQDPVSLISDIGARS
ncbi:MAG: thioredoxin fold domain-containing protein [Bdellovibrionales bacterium]